VIVKHANHVAKHGLAQHVTFNPAQKTVTIMVFATPRLENAVVNQDSLEKHVKLSYAQINVVNMVCARKNLVIVFAIKIGKDMIVPHQDVQRIVVTMVHVPLHLQVLSVLVIKNGVVIIVIPQLAQQARKR